MQTLQPSWALTPEGVLEDPIVTLDDGYIVGCSTAERHLDGPVTRLPGRLLLPGLVNAHSHAFQRAFRGHVQRDGPTEDGPAGADFWGWREAMYRVANAVDPDDVEAISRLAFLEMVRSGITEVGEFHYLHHAPGGTRYADPDELAWRVIGAAQQVGLRITLLRVAYHRSDATQALRPEQQRFGATDPDEVLQAIRRLEQTADATVRIGLAPHSVRAVPPGWLADFAAYRGIVHAHVAEQPGEVASCFAENGRSPLRVFADAGLVTDRFSAVHLTCPSAGDVDLMEAAGATAVVCPSTELDLGDGFLPVDARRRLRLALGSDSHAVIDLWHEARTLELHGRGQLGARHVLTPRSDPDGLAGRLLSAATSAGARCLGSDAGEIRPGAPADLVALDLRNLAAVGVPPLEAAVFAGHPSWVDAVWVGGRRVVEGGRHADEDRIVREGEAAIHRALAR